MKEILAFLILASIGSALIYWGWKRAKNRGDKHAFTNGLAYGFLFMALVRFVLYLLTKAGVKLC
jgi:TRAP-type C4-dicarboxylate transport system permease small subunit